ncbi:Na+:solute symporter [Vibrio fluvialis]|jgi:Na+/proline symporter|uniref:Na+/solute symporter n=2 Tax=Vibrio fluvialis TaxID=676 RepID=A0AAX2LXJ1_VIBFL|nr:MULTISPECIES: sodium:solute symporter family protein [Vibrio]HDM8033701.1 Na+:solute symporter [Vibrio fluvialis clinical-1]AMF92090.1 transporter [Vibrio fluvialis]AVH33729.1 transporter [Vibrio fluvialis]EKO3367111.1 Na+:solute symporter [Vibrio fluvialis]EKO3373467.1 Na+:solute symporter [Vibrio fluvialis]
MQYDYLVIAGYFALMVAISLLFKKMASNSTSDYFRGGGKMLWWMVGATAFMTQFSAWTFTGAAGKAFSDGFAVLAVFIGNMVAYVFAYFYFARRFRQMRVDTPTEGVKRRFGGVNEQFFTWVIIPLSVINAGVWLNGLGVFASAVFDADIVTTIWVTGLAVLAISLLSGAWGVVASDFIQTLVVAVISVACALVALYVVGGPSEIVNNFPGGFIMGPDMNYPLLLVCTFIFFVVKQLQSINNMQESYRFLNAKDSKNASKAALLALGMMVVGAVIWFIPPWASAILYPDAATQYSQLGAKAGDAVYLVFARETMPLGTVGLLMAGLFAATMSSMDSALNRNSGIFVRSFYAPIMRKGQATDKEQLRAGQIACLVNGLLVIFMAQFFNSLKHLSLFDLMMQVATLLQSPILVPLFLGILIRKTPKWAPWATVVFGMLVSWSVVEFFTPANVASWFGIDELTRREAGEMRTIITIAAHLFLTAGFFCLTTLFYKEENDSYKAQTAEFFKDVDTECVAEEGQDIVDRMQRNKLGSLVMYMAAGLSLMILIPNPMWGRLLFLGCAAVIAFVGYALKRSAGLDTVVKKSVISSN